MSHPERDTDASIFLDCSKFDSEIPAASFLHCWGKKKKPKTSHLYWCFVFVFFVLFFKASPGECLKALVVLNSKGFNGHCLQLSW